MFTLLKSKEKKYIDPIECHKCKKDITNGKEGKDYHSLRHKFCDVCVNPGKYYGSNSFAKIVLLKLDKSKSKTKIGNDSSTNTLRRVERANSVIFMNSTDENTINDNESIISDDSLSSYCSSHIDASTKRSSLTSPGTPITETGKDTLSNSYIKILGKKNTPILMKSNSENNFLNDALSKDMIVTISRSIEETITVSNKLPNGFSDPNCESVIIRKRSVSNTTLNAN